MRGEALGDLLLESERLLDLGCGLWFGLPVDLGCAGHGCVCLSCAVVRGSVKRRCRLRSNGNRLA